MPRLNKFMPSYVLRDYQKECVDLVNGLPDGCRTVVALATGLGKTLVGASLEFKGRVLWLSHRDELVRQPEKYFRARGMSFGIEKADEHADGEDVISASVQSLYHDSRLESFPKDAFDTIIVDEYEIIGINQRGSADLIEFPYSNQPLKEIVTCQTA
ncbi:MAG: DEAD/DEAH box helicase family protein [Bilifractor sp.]